MNQDGSPGEGRLAEQIQRLVRSIEVTGRTVLPRTDQVLLQSIVEASARIFGAVAAAIALITEDGQELEFKVAYNVINQNILGMRFPAHQGIAGYVFMTGQSLAITNVEEDARFNREFAQHSGYIPRCILAVPLISGGKVIGVIEVLDKVSGEPFNLQDMDLLAIFANQAAIAIDQSQQIDHLEAALLDGLKRMATADLSKTSAELLAALESQPESSEDLISLATMIHDISALGPAERSACLRILSVFQEYSRSKTTKRFR